MRPAHGRRHRGGVVECTACGIGRHHRILVFQRLSQRRLNRLRIGSQIDEGISGEAAEGGVLMPKQLDQQRNGRRTDSPDDLESLLMQAFIVNDEESSQQWQRAPRPLDQCGFGGGADLRIVGQQAIGPPRSASRRTISSRIGSASAASTCCSDATGWTAGSSCSTSVAVRAIWGPPETKTV